MFSHQYRLDGSNTTYLYHDTECFIDDLCAIYIYTNDADEFNNSCKT